MMMRALQSWLACSFLLLGTVSGHGRLELPPCRASMWRFGFDTLPDYDDNQLFCGGLTHQLRMGGKCGICGDPYDEPAPRAHEIGGPYYRGLLAANYSEGEAIDVTVQITANHKGFFQFKICPVPGFKTEATQECLDRHVLRLAGSVQNRYWVRPEYKEVRVRLQLPTGLTCQHCVLQWRYHAGNNWGVCEDGSQAVGCGDQEEFYGCSDVSIRENTRVSTPEPDVSSSSLNITRRPRPTKQRQWRTSPQGTTLRPRPWRTIAPAWKTTTPSRRTTVLARRTSAPSRRTTVLARRTIAPSRRTTAPSQKATAPARRTTAPVRRTTVLSRRTPAPARRTPASARRTTAPSRRTTVLARRTPAPSWKTTAPSQKTSASARRTTAPVRRTTVLSRRITAPVRRTTVLSRRTTTPVRRTTAPARRTTAPARRTTAPDQTTTAPVRRTTVLFRNTTLPARRTTVLSRRATAPARRTTVPTRRTSAPARRTTGQARRTTGPARRTTVLSHSTTASVRETTAPARRTAAPCMSSSARRDQCTNCVAVPPWDHSAGMDVWCRLNCLRTPAFCPASHCRCLDKTETEQRAARHGKITSRP